MRGFFRIMLMLLLCAGTAAAQSVTVTGQLRQRSEFNDKSFNEATHHDVFHLLRARLGATATVNEQVSVHLEVQDARTFGESGSTLNGSAQHFDLRQGYLEITGLADDVLSVKLGRQVLSYGNERLLGAIDWSNVGQSFDAGVLRLNFGDVKLDAFGAALLRNTAAPLYVRDVVLAGSWVTWAPKESRVNVHGFWLFDNPATETVRQNRHTAGLLAGGHAGMLDYEVEAAAQFGDHMMAGMETHHISANIVGARVGYRFPELLGLRVGAGFDRLSGRNPDDSDSYTVFNTLYGTNHKYYGYMDYFTNIPLHTSGLGLQDIIAQISIAPSKSFWLGVDVHLFSTVTDLEKALAPRDPEWASSIGTEIDVTAKWKVAEVVNMTAGFSVFNANKDRAVLLLAQGTPTESTSWGYLMTSVQF